MTIRLFRPETGAADIAPVSVAEVLTLYLRHSKAEGKHVAEVIRQRQRTYGLFIKDYGELAVSQCKRFHLTDFIESHPEWRSAYTKRMRATAIAAAFNWALEEERIERNPFQRQKYKEGERRPDMPDDVLGKIASLCGKAVERAIRFLRLTGCRTCELRMATWDQIDLDRGVWTIPTHKSRKQTGKPRVVALVPEAIDLLRDVARAQAPSSEAGGVLTPNALDGSVFLNTRGRPWCRNGLGSALNRVKRKYRIQTEASLHGIRHRFGSACVAAGAPIKLVSAQLGHSSVATTERYYCDLTGEIEAIRDAAELGLPKI